MSQATDDDVIMADTLAKPTRSEAPPTRASSTLSGISRTRQGDIITLGGATALALGILAAWTGEWLFCLVLAFALASIAVMRLYFARNQVTETIPGQTAIEPVLGGDAAAAGNKGIQDLIERMPDPIMMLDQNGRILAANSGIRSLFDGAEPRKHIANIIRNPSVLEAFDAVSVGATARTVEFSILATTERAFEAHIAPMDHYAGKPRTVLMVLHDLTRAKRVEEMRADFVANASHELRTPLASLTGFIETLRGHARDDAEARERFLGIMSDQATRMRRLIDDLLSLSRIELNEHVRPAGHVNMGDVVEEAVGALSPVAERSATTIAVDEPPTLPHVAGDREELYQVVQNLVDNAIKYGRQGGKIAISMGLRRPASGEPGPSPAVFVSVKDDGPGIAREHLPRLTERFYRVDVRRSREVGGTGLGLAIVKHIVNRHRGRFLIDSKPGEGATFTVLLPLASVVTQEEAGVPRLPAAGPRMR